MTPNNRNPDEETKQLVAALLESGHVWHTIRDAALQGAVKRLRALGKDPYKEDGFVERVCERIVEAIQKELWPVLGKAHEMLDGSPDRGKLAFLMIYTWATRIGVQAADEAVEGKHPRGR